MEDQEILDNEVEEVVTQDNDPNESEQAEENQAEMEATAETKQDRNWRAMEQRQKELEYALKQRDDVIDKFLKQPQQQQSQPVVEEPELPDDDFIPVSGVKKIASKHVKPLEAKIEQLEKQLAQQEQNKRMESLRVKYSDFDDVVNVETLELLEKNEPELAASLMNKDPYEIGLMSYKYIKAFNLKNDLPNARRKKEIDKKLEKNAKTVQSPTAYDKRPVAQAMKSTAADQKRLYEEMIYYASQASGL